MSDIFGVNGRRVLDGLVAERSPRCILAGLTSHVRAKLAPLAKALATTLDPLSLFALQMQVEAVDPADDALAALDTRIQTALGVCAPERFWDLMVGNCSLSVAQEGSVMGKTVLFCSIFGQPVTQ